jgi:hypothetical protein
VSRACRPAIQQGQPWTRGRRAGGLPAQPCYLPDLAFERWGTERFSGALRPA